MRWALFTQLWRRHRIRVAVIGSGAGLWGFLAPVIYKAFSGTSVLQSLPQSLSRFGSGDLASLGGVITIMYEHPFLVAMVLTLGVSVVTSAIAGARASGSLELVLARPVSRTAVVGVTAATALVMLAVVLLAGVAGTVVGAAVEGVTASLPLGALPVVWLESLLLFGGFTSVALLASAMSDRSGRALPIAIGFVMANYFVEVLGSLWSPAQPYQKLSLFAHFLPNAIIAGTSTATDALILSAFVVAPALAALAVFRRRDLGAPG